LPPIAASERSSTSSLRRQAQLRARRPDLRLVDLRGNVNTRLAKLDGGDYAAIVLACAGLQRLGLDARIRARLDAPQWLPAPAQGAIAIECRDGDAATRALCAVLDDAHTRTCVEAERAMNLALHGSCHVPVAAYARLTDGRLVLSGLVGSAHSGRLVRASSVAMEAQAQDLGLDVAEKLLAQGAGALLAGSGEPDTGPFVS
jgi:hydroxymethylbilane synthase